MSATAAPIRNLQGQITGAVTLARDITERHRMEQALSARTRELDVVLESMTDGVIVFDAAGRPQRTNRASRAQQVRYAPPEDLARSITDRAVGRPKPTAERQQGMCLYAGDDDDEVSAIRDWVWLHSPCAPARGGSEGDQASGRLQSTSLPPWSGRIRGSIGLAAC